MSITFESVDLKVMAVFLCSQLSVRKCTLNIMPPFTPNDAMLNMHADKGKEDWEIYAWCVRNAMAKAGDFEERPNHSVLKERLDYYDFLMRRKDVLEVGDKKFYIDRLAYQEFEDEDVIE